MDTATAVTAPPGLKGLVVADTTIGEVRGAEGFYHYRGIPAPELARTRAFSDVWSLVVDGRLPGPDESQRFAAEIGAGRVVAAGARDAVRAAAELPALTALRIGLAVVGADSRPVIDLEPHARRGEAIRVAAAVPTLVAAHQRARLGAEPVAPDPGSDHVADLLCMISGHPWPPAAVDAVRTYLVATIDHGFNASTFTARVVTSTGADVASAVIAAIGALSGPLHGGAPSRVLDMLDEIGSPDDAGPWVRDALADGRRIMGFGHAVYRETDPRSALLRETAERLGGPRVVAAAEIEGRILDELARAKDRRFATNVEFWSAVALEAAGVARELFTPLFVTSRVVGWTAHILEQSADPRIMRPSSRYVGESP